MNAAMGLSNLPYLSEIISERRKISELYDTYLENCLKRPAKQKDLMYNFAYYPVLFESETELKEVFNALSKDGIHPRRYFYPSLNKLPYLENTLDCPISEDIASRIACLPLFIGLELGTIEKICKIIRGVCKV